MWNILGYIGTAVAMEALTQIIEQDRQNMRLKDQALQARRDNNRLLNDNHCARGKIQDQLMELEKEYDKLDVNSAERDAKLKDLDSKYKVLREQGERLRGQAEDIINNGFKIDDQIKRTQYLKVEFKKLRPKLTTNLTKLLGVVSALATLAQLAQYAKEKMDHLKNQQDEIGEQISKCSSTSSLALNVNSLNELVVLLE